MRREDIFGFSFRMGENITYCHPADKTEQFDGTKTGNILTWEWPANPGVDFAYPFELNATVYRREDVSQYFKMIDGIDRWHPNVIEAAFYRQSLRSAFLHRPVMASYAESHAYVLTVNRVQDVAKNPVYEEHSADELLEAFYRGKQVNLKYYLDKTYRSIHIGEFKLKSASGAR